MKDIGTFVVTSANYSLDIEEWSVSQKQGIIVCILKSDKDRQKLKNWRVISLLNVACKIISTCTEERMKKVLSKIIHMDQTGFMSGWFIGENIRVLYDIMHMAEQRGMPVCYSQ